jgi:hypothetical protein
MQEDMRAENRARLLAAEKPTFRDELFSVEQVWNLRSSREPKLTQVKVAALLRPGQPEHCATT